MVESCDERSKKRNENATQADSCTIEKDEGIRTACSESGSSPGGRSVPTSSVLTLSAKAASSGSSPRVSLICERLEASYPAISGDGVRDGGALTSRAKDILDWPF